MSAIDRIDLERLVVRPGTGPNLADRDPGWAQDLGIGKKEGREELEAAVDRIAGLQERLFAEGRRAVLLVLQAMDTGGKDSTIRAVTRGLNPQGCRVVGFKAPSRAELARDFLWRVHAEVPPKGTVGIFNRSHYEDVLIVKVHGWAPPDAIERRYDHINAFERLLHDGGTRVVKVMLHISKDYQLQQLRERVETPEKRWKFNPDDLAERELWDRYHEAYETALARCSTAASPWYVVPAETKWFRNLAVARILLDTLREMDPQYPEPSWDPGDFTASRLR